MLNNNQTILKEMKSSDNIEYVKSLYLITDDNTYYIDNYLKARCGSYALLQFQRSKENKKGGNKMLKELIKRLNNTADCDIVMFANYIKVLKAYHDITEKDYSYLKELINNKLELVLYHK